MSTTRYETGTETLPRGTHVLDVTEVDYGTVVEYVEAGALDAYFERTDGRVLLVTA